MKKFVILFNLLLSVFIFYTVLRVYDAYLAKNLFTGQPSHDDEEVLLNIYGDYGDVDPEEFSTLFKSFVQENDLEAFKTNTVGSDRFYFIYSDNQKYLNQIVLEKGTVGNLTQFESYSTNHENKSRRILNPIKNDSFTILPFDSYEHENWIIQGPYILRGMDDTILEAFVNEIYDNYPQLTVQYTDIDRHDYIHQFDFKDISLIITLCVLLLSIIVAHVISVTKKISIMKLEGDSIIAIYGKLILRDLVWGVAISLLTTTILYIMFIGVPTTKVPFFWSRLLSLLFIYHVFIFIGSFVALTLISLTGVNVGVKGKNSLLRMEMVLRACQFILIIACVIPMVRGVDTFITILNGELAEPFQKKRDTNLYKISSYRIYYADELSKEEQLNQVKSHLVNNNKMFLFMNTSPEVSEKNHYIVDNQYLLNHNIELTAEDIQKCDDITCYYSTRDTIVDVWETTINVKKNIPVINYYNYDNNLYSEYGTKGNEQFPSLVSIDDALFEVTKDTSLLNHFYYYDGNIEESQEYLNGLLGSYGIAPVFTIESPDIAYNNRKKDFLVESINVFLNMMMLLTSYVILSYMVISVNVELNRNKYRLLIFDGASSIDLIINQLLINGTSLISMMIVSIMVFKISIVQSICIALVLMVLEAVISFMVFRASNIKGGE